MAGHPKDPAAVRTASRSDAAAAPRDSAFVEVYGSIAPPQGVLHVVGRVTEAVFHLLGPACAALHAEGRQQAVLMFGDVEGSELIKRLDPAIVLHTLKDTGNALQRWHRLARSLNLVVLEGRWEAVYLHGLMPLVVGAPLARRIHKRGGRLFVTPHNSRSLRSMRWLGSPVLRLIDQWIPLKSIQTIANVPFDVRALKRIASVSARLIESPVDAVFFSVNAQSTSITPVIVGGANSDAAGAAQLFAQLAVLLAESLPQGRFVWLAAADADERALLQASGVEVNTSAGDAYERAQVLAGANIYIAPGSGQGFSMLLAEAMAVGLPCVARADDALNDMLTHGETGLLGDTAGAMAQQVLSLLRDTDQRQLLAEQARREAILRFSDEDFRRHLVSAFKDARI